MQHSPVARFMTAAHSARISLTSCSCLSRHPAGGRHERRAHHERAHRQVGPCHPGGRGAVAARSPCRRGSRQHGRRAGACRLARSAADCCRVLFAASVRRCCFDGSLLGCLLDCCAGRESDMTAPSCLRAGRHRSSWSCFGRPARAGLHGLRKAQMAQVCALLALSLPYACAPAHAVIASLTSAAALQYQKPYVWQDHSSAVVNCACAG